MTLPTRKAPEWTVTQHGSAAPNDRRAQATVTVAGDGSVTATYSGPGQFDAAADIDTTLGLLFQASGSSVAVPLNLTFAATPGYTSVTATLTANSTNYSLAASSPPRTADVAATHSAYIYPFEGSVEISDRVLKTHQGGVLGSGDKVEIKAGPDGARFLVLAAKPLKEPVVQYGPFVMNTRAEIEQAIRDYQSGELTKAA